MSAEEEVLLAEVAALIESRIGPVEDQKLPKRGKRQSRGDSRATSRSKGRVGATEKGESYGVARRRAEGQRTMERGGGKRTFSAKQHVKAGFARKAAHARAVEGRLKSEHSVWPGGVPFVGTSGRHDEERSDFEIDRLNGLGRASPHALRAHDPPEALGWSSRGGEVVGKRGKRTRETRRAKVGGMVANTMKSEVASWGKEWGLRDEPPSPEAIPSADQLGEWSSSATRVERRGARRGSRKPVVGTARRGNGGARHKSGFVPSSDPSPTTEPTSASSPASPPIPTPHAFHPIPHQEHHHVSKAKRRQAPASPSPSPPPTKPPHPAGFIPSTSLPAASLLPSSSVAALFDSLPQDFKAALIETIERGRYEQSGKEEHKEHVSEVHHGTRKKGKERTARARTMSIESIDSVKSKGSYASQAHIARVHASMKRREKLRIKPKATSKPTTAAAPSPPSSHPQPPLPPPSTHQRQPSSSPTPPATSPPPPGVALASRGIALAVTASARIQESTSPAPSASSSSASASSKSPRPQAKPIHPRAPSSPVQPPPPFLPDTSSSPQLHSMPGIETPSSRARVIAELSRDIKRQEELLGAGAVASSSPHDRPPLSASAAALALLREKGDSDDAGKEDVVHSRLRGEDGSNTPTLSSTSMPFFPTTPPRRSKKEKEGAGSGPISKEPHGSSREEEVGGVVASSSVLSASSLLSSTSSAPIHQHQAFPPNTFPLSSSHAWLQESPPQASPPHHRHHPSSPSPSSPPSDSSPHSPSSPMGSRRSSLSELSVSSRTSNSMMLDAVLTSHARALHSASSPHRHHPITPYRPPSQPAHDAAIDDASTSVATTLSKMKDSRENGEDVDAAVAVTPEKTGSGGGGGGGGGDEGKGETKGDEGGVVAREDCVDEDALLDMEVSPASPAHTTAAPLLPSPHTSPTSLPAPPDVGDDDDDDVVEGKKDGGKREVRRTGKRKDDDGETGTSPWEKVYGKGRPIRRKKGDRQVDERRKLGKGEEVHEGSRSRKKEVVERKGRERKPPAHVRVSLETALAASPPAPASSPRGPGRVHVSLVDAQRDASARATDGRPMSPSHHSSSLLPPTIPPPVRSSPRIGLQKRQKSPKAEGDALAEAVAERKRQKRELEAAIASIPSTKGFVVHK